MRRLFHLGLLAGLSTIPLQSQSFDTSGNGSISGAYFFRYLVHATTQTTGAVGEGCTVSGVMTFNGVGSYTVSNTQLYDSAGSSGMCGTPKNGNYSLESTGLLEMDNPVFSTSASAVTIFGAYSAPVITGSSTEDGYYDLFVAIKAPTGSVSNSALTGSFNVGSMEFLNTQSSLARDSYFTLTANGAGSVSTLSVNGSAVNLGTNPVVQSIAGVTYTVSSTGAGTLNFPLPSGANAQNQLLSGSKVLYISSDGNYVLGGSTAGLDMIFGVRAAAAGSSNTLLNGSYFIAGFEADLSQLSTNYSFLDAYYGGINTGGTGSAIWHQRLNDVTDGATYDNTFNTTFNVNSSGISNDGAFMTLVGANGQAFISVGVGTQYGLDIALRAPTVTPTSKVWINPTGILNAANYTPITNSYAPGELVSIFGIFGVTAQLNGKVPIPTTLGGVQVLVNGVAAPISSIGPNQINALIPYGVGTTFAVFQVVVNGSTSNSITLYVAPSSPGVYTTGQNGIGPGAILHANFTPVSSSSPAAPGETVLLFANGFGAVTPAVADGAAGPTNPLSTANDTVTVFLDDGVDNLAQATVAYSGLAPGFPGLYQVNFKIPSTGLVSGNIYVNLQTNEAATEMSTIYVTGFPKSQAIPASRRNLHNSARARMVRQFVPHNHR